MANSQSATPDLQSPIGFLTAYVPEELFHAAGLTPVFVLPTPRDRGGARAHLPSFTCWIVGSALDQALTGALDHLVGMVIAKTCDTTQGLADLWQLHAPHIPLYHFGMPLRLNAPSARGYLLAELQDLHARIQSAAGRPISDGALKESIALYNRVRTLVRRLYAHATSPAPVLFGPDGGRTSALRASAMQASALYDLVRAAFQTPKQSYEEKLAQLLEQPAPPGEASRAARNGHPRLLLSGPALGDPILFEILDSVGAQVAGDFFDLGERYFAIDAAEDGDPIEALADRLMASLPTPTKHHSRSTRAEGLLSLLREREPDGVIFARQKFCDPHGFDYVQMAQVLEEASVPHLLIELEQASQAGQMRTRIEAFVEMITQ
jgi:benzoyl-CoA reductase/2-hydroxyglutaryl-CoA dehydratase subunit BcrC/BadD/HgdB